MNILINHFKAIHGVDTMSTAPYSTGAVWNRLRWRNINDGIWFAELHLAHEYIQRWLNTHLVTFPHGQFLQPFTTILFKAKSLVQLEMILRPLHFQHCASRFWSFLFGLDGFIFYIQHAMGDPGAPPSPSPQARFLAATHCPKLLPNGSLWHRDVHRYCESLDTAKKEIRLLGIHSRARTQQSLHLAHDARSSYQTGPSEVAEQTLFGPSTESSNLLF